MNRDALQASVKSRAAPCRFDRNSDLRYMLGAEPARNFADYSGDELDWQLLPLTAP